MITLMKRVMNGLAWIIGGFKTWEEMKKAEGED